MKTFVVRLILFCAIAWTCAYGQSDTARYPYDNIVGTGVRIMRPRGFHWTFTLNGTNNAGFTNDSGATMVVHPLPQPLPATFFPFDSLIERTVPGSKRLSAQAVTIDGYKGWEYVAGSQRLVMDYTVFGDSTHSVILVGAAPKEEADSLLPVFRYVFARAKWNPHPKITAADLFFQFAPATPFTRMTTERGMLQCTPEDTAGHGLVPSFRTIYLTGGGTPAENRRARTSSYLMTDRLLDVAGIDSISDCTMDSLPAVTIRTRARSAAGDKNLQVFLCAAFDTNGVYVMRGITEASAAATNMRSFETMAASFKRKESYAHATGMASDLVRKKRYKEALVHATRATELYPDSSLGFWLKAQGEHLLGLYSEGLADIAKAGALSPTVLTRPYLRGNLEEQTGDAAAAEKDYAEEIRQKDTLNYFGIGRFHFAMGRYAEAAENLRAFNLKGNDPYAHIWQFFAEWKAAGKDDATAHLKSFRDKANLQDKFCGEIIRYLLGELTEDELIAHSEFAINQSDTENFCEATFYAGMNNLLLGSPAKTKEYWQKTIDSGVTNFVEYMYAKAHMQQ